MEKLLACIFLVLAPVAAHICLITPRQRGKFDISTSGSRTCFKHGFPCGGDTPLLPQYILQAGKPAFIKWQQNYNHYEVGFPGYMDISIGPVDSKSEDQWTILAVVADKYVFSQDYQENYTAIVNIPNTPCNHCVIRVRYNPHKAGEDTFYQCSDIQVSSNSEGNLPLSFHMTDTKDKPLKRAAQLVTFQKSTTSTGVAESIYGEAYDPFNPARVTYVSVDPATGVKSNIAKMNFALDAQKPDAGDVRYIADAVVSLDPDRQTSLFMYHGAGSLDTIPRQFLEIGLSNGSVISSQNIPALNGTTAINALAYASPGKHFTFSIEEVSFPAGNYLFVVGELDLTGAWKNLAQTHLTENLYVNFQWMVHDPVKNLLHVLMGNENAADALNARIYTYSTAPGSEAFVKSVELNVSEFTFMSLYFYRKTGQLFAISPGLFINEYPAYSLVEIDLSTGGVREFMKVTPPGIFEKYYGGSIFNGVSDQGVIKHLFRVADSEADVIASIDIENQQVTFSQLTNLRHIHNLVYAPAMP